VTWLRSTSYPLRVFLLHFLGRKLGLTGN